MATATAFANANTIVTTGWTNPTNAYADDAVYATAAPAKSTSITTDYGFPSLAIPALSSLTSVTFEFQFKSSTTSSTGAVIGLQGNDNGSLMGSESTFGMSLTDVTQTKQYTTSLPTVTELNTANTVKARVRGFRSTSNTAITWSVDYVKITVVYTPGYQLVGESGTLAESGQPASLLVGKKLTAASGAVALTGNAVTLTQGSAAKTLVADTGAIAISGGAAALKVGRLLPTTAGSLTLSGQPAALLFKHVLPAVSGSFSLTGSPTTFAKGRTLAAEPGALSITGAPVNGSKAWQLSAASNSFTVAGSPIVWAEPEPEPVAIEPMVLSEPEHPAPYQVIEYPINHVSIHYWSNR